MNEAPNLDILASRVFGCGDTPPEIAKAVAAITVALDVPDRASNDDVSYAVREFLGDAFAKVADGDMNAGELARLLRSAAEYFDALAAVQS